MSRSADPLISVIVPVYNGARFLLEAVASVRQQDYRPLEIIIVDDGSSDETARLAATLGRDVVYVYEDNRGPAAARNRGLSVAGGDPIAFLDVDDLWPPGKLKAQLAHLRAEPRLDVLLSRLQVVRLPDAPDTTTPLADTPLRNVHLGGGLFRRAALDKVGPFDETLRFSEDHDWFLRAREQGLTIAIGEEVGLYYRRHEGNLTRQDDSRGFQLAEVLKRSLDRRRRQHGGRARALPEIPDLEKP